MGLIINAESHANVYRNDVINQDQMNIDNSTVTNEDMNVYKEFAKQSAAYLQRKKPIYDFKTKNRSFIQLYKDLKKLGVQNNKFFLILMLYLLHEVNYATLLLYGLNLLI